MDKNLDDKTIFCQFLVLENFLSVSSHSNPHGSQIEFNLHKYWLISSLAFISIFRINFFLPKDTLLIGTTQEDSLTTMLLTIFVKKLRAKLWIDAYIVID